MGNTISMNKIVVFLPDDQKRDFKVACAKRKKTMTDMLLIQIERVIQEEKEK